MRVKIVFTYLIFLFLDNASFAQKECPVIPLPNHFEKGTGAFVLNKNTTISLNDTALHPLAIYLEKILDSLHIHGVKILNNGDQNVIRLEKNNEADSAYESYQLLMTKKSVVIRSATREGLFDGIITLLQLIKEAPLKNSARSVSCWNIRDTAAYKWRGLMLDESRHFFGKKTVKKILDWMAFYKLNRFHWHLTDEPGWRLQINQYTRLTTVGAIGNTSDASAPAAYYTTKDIHEIVRYASERCIKVIPEIDMPGHATAANRAYPEFSGGGTGKYADFTFNPGKNETYTFLTNILKETKKLFPSGLIHLGGDEVSFGSESWKNDAGVEKLMQKNDLSDLKAVEEYFIRRMADSALKIFRKVLVWDEATDASLPVDSTIIFWWRHDKPMQLEKALHKGYSVVLCPRLPLYFDFVQDSAHTLGRKWNGKFNSLADVYRFNASALHGVTIENEGQILGIQANLWTETIVDEQRLDTMLFPRIAALAEAAWTMEKNKNFDSFKRRLISDFTFYRKAGIYY